MNPEQNGGQQPVQTPVPNPGESGHDPYDFIMNPAKPVKKPLLVPTGSPLLARIALVGGGLAVLLIVGIVGFSIISSGGKEKTEALLTIAQEQTELIRVATDGSKNATGLPAQNLAQSVQASVTSDNSELLAYLKKNGQTPSKVQLAAKQDKVTDKTLSDALASNSYDSAFKTALQAELTSYLATLQKAYKDNPGPKGKELLSKQYNSAELLLKASK